MNAQAKPRRPARSTRADLVDALRAATAYVELYTPNGVREQPPEWAAGYDPATIAENGRRALARAAT